MSAHKGNFISICSFSNIGCWCGRILGPYPASAEDGRCASWREAATGRGGGVAREAPQLPYGSTWGPDGVWELWSAFLEKRVPFWGPPLGEGGTNASFTADLGGGGLQELMELSSKC